VEGSRTILHSRGLALLFAALLAVACSAGGDTRPAGAESTAPSHPLGGGTGRIAYACEVNYKNALLDICTSRLDGSRRVRVTHARTNEFDPSSG
jgi:hypothetical protein